MSRLTIHDGGRAIAHDLLDDVVVIGTREGVSIRISDPDAGPEHCQIQSVPGVGYKLVDLESRIGTKVNGAYVNQHVLRNGDMIQVGKVRIDYTGDAPPAAAAPPRAVPAARPAAARAAPPRPPMARPPAGRPPRAAPPPGQRDQAARRPRPPRAGGSPLVLAASLVGLLVLVLLFATLVDWNNANEQVYRDMVAAIQAKEYQRALQIAKQADPGGDPDFLKRIEIEEKNVKDLLAAGPTKNEEMETEYRRVEIWIQNHPEDKAGAVDKWDEYLAKYGDTFWGTQAKIRRAEALGRKRGDPLYSDPGERGGGRTPVAPSGNAKIDRNWSIALATVQEKLGGDCYQDAIDELWKFWEKNQLLTTELSAWEGRVKEQVEKIQDRAESRYQELDGLAKNYVDQGEYDQALRIYRKIAERFGMAKYQQKANREIRKLSKD